MKERKRMLPKKSPKLDSNHLEFQPFDTNWQENFELKSNSLSLNPQQQNAFQMIMEGKNVCILGNAGVGKSFLLKEVIGELEKKYNQYEVRLFVTSMTGKTSVNLKGFTLHSFAGIGNQGDTDYRLLLSKVIRNKWVWERWYQCQALIIDEISMLSGQLFDKLERIARVVKDNNEPFGGIQLIISGDFYQLPPVWRKKDIDFKWAFEAESWSRCFPKPQQVTELTTIYRQTDQKYIKALQEIRNNCLSSANLKYLTSLKREPKWPDDGIRPTRIYATNKEVDKINELEINRLSTPAMIYHAQKSGAEKALWVIEKSCSTPIKLTLKVGAQVMLTKNLFHEDKLLFNGMQGKVIGFKKRERNFPVPIIQFVDGQVVTIEETKWEFTGWREVGGESKETVIATLTQIPLTLSWAITVHKSQGQSIERLVVDCSNIWLRGQLYVALSRATNPNHLQIIGFDKSKIIYCEKVEEFYRSLV